MRKRGIIVLVMLAFVVSVAMFGCGGGSSKDTEKEPTVVITSGNGTITTAQTYRLEYSSTNAKSEQVTVSGGTYDRDTKLFSASAAGTYTITVTVTNVKKTANAGVTVTVTEAALPQDTTAPEIVFAEHGELTVAVNTSLTLPAATVTDDTDGDITAALEVGADPQAGTQVDETETAGVYTFRAEAAGEYSVSYYAVDRANNENEQFLTVTVTPATTETEITADENKIENLAVSESTYKENFAKGYNSPFAKGLNFSTMPKASISGGTDAIAGNSLLLDYNGASPTSDTAFYFSAMDSYIRSGRWTVSMDIKVVGGTVPTGNFYLAFTEQGAMNLDASYTISQTGITTVRYSAIRTFEVGKTYWFRCAWYDGGSPDYTNFKLAIDNIVITRKDVEDATVTRTGTPVAVAAADLDGAGKTITGAADNYTAVSGTGNPKYVQIDKLVTGDLLTSQQAADITSSNGFNSLYAIYCTGQINNFDAFRNLCTDTGYTYTLTLRVYAVGGGWHIFITNAGNRQEKAEAVSGTGAQTWTCTFDGNDSYVNVGLYNGGETTVLVGDITLQRVVREIPAVDPTVTRTGSAVTVAAADLDGAGKTITGADDNYTAVSGSGNPKYVQIDKLVEGKYLTAEEAANLTSANGFTGGYAVYFTNELNYFDSLTNLFSDGGYTYSITIKMYIPQMTGNIHLFKKGASVHAFGTHTGAYTLTQAEIPAGDGQIGLYIEGGSGKFFVGDITVSRTVKAAPAATTPSGHAVGKTWTYDYATETPLNPQKFTTVTTAEVAALADKEGFGAQCLQFNQAANFTAELLRSGNAILEAQGKYKITLWIYVVNAGSTIHLNFDDKHFPVVVDAGTTGYVKAEIEVSGTAVDFISVYTGTTGGGANLYIGKMQIELTEIL